MVIKYHPSNMGVNKLIEKIGNRLINKLGDS